MSTITTNWDASWTATDTASDTITNTSSLSTETLSNDGKSATEVSVTVAYGSTADEGVKVYVLRDTDGTNFESVADMPWGFEMPYSTSTTYRRTFTVCADRISKFKVHLTNDTGASVTGTVNIRQAVIDAV